MNGTAFSPMGEASDRQRPSYFCGATNFLGSMATHHLLGMFAFGSVSEHDSEGNPGARSDT